MSDDDTTTPSVTAPSRDVKAVDVFVEAHGETVAVVQGVSMDQVRITLVGEDGALGDVLVRDAAVATAVVAASRATEGEWSRETAAAVTLDRGYRTRMASGGGGRR